MVSVGSGGYGMARLDGETSSSSSSQGERTSDKGIDWTLIGDRDREREPDGASEGEKKGDWK